MPRAETTRFSNSSPASRAATTSPVRQRIAGIQRQLAALGYQPGPADGILGPKSRAAIRAFEVREGLPVTGGISRRLEAALRSAIPTLASKAAPARRPLKKASTGSGFIVSSQGHILFAVSQGSARAFLDGHDVPYETARSNKPLPTADIAAKAKGCTVLIECWK